MKYEVIGEFLDANQNRRAINDEVSDSDYDESTISRYLKQGLISKKTAKKATGPKKNKAAKPSKNK